MITVKNVTKTFDGFKALDGLNINAPSGCVYGLVGPNGAGKSTIIRHLTGVYRQDSGEVLIDGQPVYENPEIKSKIFYIPDEFYYFISANTRDMKRFYQGIYPSFDNSRYEKLKSIFSIDEKASIRRLSKGMQKQVAFWLALSVNPQILILDEPVDGLDPVMRRQIWSLVMGDVAENGMTVLISSHNLRELEDVCDHVGIINHGKMMLERPLSELQDNITKVQIVFQDQSEPDLSDLNILHRSCTGKIQTLIIRGGSEEIGSRIAAKNPLFSDLLPLTLEEIFIYELGGTDYEVKDIVL